jgi:DhnA family fructose-bisphosphate aldolase class Ia
MPPRRPGRGSRASFDPRTYLPFGLVAAITDARVDRPDIVREEAEKRQRRNRLTENGRLVILAADHPARMVVHTKKDPLAMANRHDYLARVVRALTAPGVDGVMGSPDILEELFILNRLVRERGGRPFLDFKILVGSMNRGGLAGTAFELEDRFTAYTVDRLVALRLDGGKLMFRLDPRAPESGRTIAWCAEEVTSLTARRLPAFLEPLMVKRERGRYVASRNPADVAKVVSAAAALGESSLGLWLKVPPTKHFARVAQATTCPLLLLGGDASGKPMAVLREIHQAMESGSNVRGALIGRNVLYPGQEDPRAMAAVVAALVHDKVPPAKLGPVLAATRGVDPVLAPA